MFLRITVIAIIVGNGVNAAQLKSNDLLVERITGAPPTKTIFLTEDSGGKIRRLNRNSSPGLYIFMNTTQDLPNATMFWGKLYRGADNTYKTVLLEYKRNLCDYLINEKLPLFNSMKTMLGLPEKCPVPQGIYKVDNWHIENYLPPILPTGQGFRLQAGMEFTKTENIVMNVFFRVGRKR